MKKVPSLCLATALIASSSLWATENTTATNANTTTAEKTRPYGDNPSLGRVLLYKTGKGLQNLGESIQGASENTSQKMSEKWKTTKEYTAEQSVIVQEQTEKAKQHHTELVNAIENETVDMVQYEKEKIKGAVRTDFILSAEIIVITLGVVQDRPFIQQLGVLVGISLLMTVGVYGLVGGIVKLDDVGLWLLQKKSSIAQAFGKLALWIMPRLMKALAFIGTLAMFLVGGSIIAHNSAAAIPLRFIAQLPYADCRAMRAHRLSPARCIRGRPHRDNCVGTISRLSPHR